ncbi:MAG: TerC family protein [Planctomycetales bacterium]|nr:TerC family protein [Planctomycetales bacterium]
MEIVLGIDNIVFIAIITGKLPRELQPRARKLGLLLALGTRIALLCTLSWIMGLTKPIFEFSQLGITGLEQEANEFSTRDLILLAGGLFLIAKSVLEIHDKVHGETEEHGKQAGISFVGVLFQIAVLDVVFSLDSVITAVGMSEDLWVMVTAVVLAVGVMLTFAEPISAFVENHPTLKVLALSFLILIGFMLTADSLGKPIPKGYIYFAMAFALGVESINLRVRPVHRASQGSPAMEARPVHWASQGSPAMEARADQHDAES